MNGFVKLFFLFILLSTHVISVKASEEIDLFTYSLQDLLNVKVSTASKQERSLDESPAFIEIVSQDDIKRRIYKKLTTSTLALYYHLN